MIPFFRKTILLFAGVGAQLILFCVPHAAKAATSTTTMSSSATVSGVNSFELSLRNIADDQQAGGVQFPSPSGITKAAQYLQLDFDSNALGARIIIRTDNRNNSIPYTGTGEGAGLVGNPKSDETAPLLWAVFDDLAPAKAFAFTGDTDPDGQRVGSLPGANARPAGEAEGLVVDKANANFETQNVLEYATVILPAGANGLLGSFPTDEDGAGPSTGLRSATSPIFLVLGADFVNARPQRYGTTTLGLDLIVQ